MKPRKFKPLITSFLAGMLLLHLLMAWNVRNLLRKGYADFTIFYCAGRIVQQGLAKNLYDPQVQFRVQQQFAGEVDIRHGPLPYNHPPFEALAFVPLTWFAYFPAYLLWDGLNLLALFALPVLLRPYVPWLQHTSTVFVVFASVAFFPVFIGLLQGQDIILLLLLFALAFVSLKKHNDFAAGCWLGLGLFRFHLVLPLVLVLLLQKRKRVGFGFALVALALGLVSVAVTGWATVIHYPSYIWSLEAVKGHGAIVPADMPNLRGFLSVLLTGRTPKFAADVLVGFLSLGLLLFTSSRWKAASTEAQFDLGFSLALVMTVLVSYHAEAYDLSLLFLPLVLLPECLRQAEPLDWWTKISFLSPAFLLFLTPLHLILRLRYEQLNLLAPVLVLWLVGLASEISRTRGTPPKNNVTIFTA
jgi:hypothetical protein